MTPTDHKAQQISDELALIKAHHREAGLRLQLAEAQQRERVYRVAAWVFGISLAGMVIAETWRWLQS
jgi:hypothetical protein